MSIPIQNIYYLLCYAWNKLDEKEVVNVDAIDSTEIIDLFAKVLSNSISRLLKQGLDRYYIENQNEILGIKGKINLSESVKRNSFSFGKSICRYDEFDYNILHNQILKTTILKLLRAEKLNNVLKDELLKIYQKFPASIDEILIKDSDFSKIILHRNNYNYDFILKVCRILNENLLINEKEGSYKFKDFIRDEKRMAYVFESFVRNFYRIETNYKVGRENIKWQLLPIKTGDAGVLPYMETDVTLQTKSRKIIIDTKYYKEALKTKFDKKKIISSNLYQIYAYVKNQENENEVNKNCDGILLYPSVENDFNYGFKQENHTFKVISINLNQQWEKIKNDLLKIVE